MASLLDFSEVVEQEEEEDRGYVLPGVQIPGPHGRERRGFHLGKLQRQ